MSNVCIYMTIQQSGTQHTQQSHPPTPQSRHLVLPGTVPPGLMIELVAEPGRTKLTGLDVDSVHMLFEGTDVRNSAINLPRHGQRRSQPPSMIVRKTYLWVLYIYRKLWFVETMQLLHWALRVGQSDQKQDAMPLVPLCTLARPRGTLTVPMGNG